MEVSPAVVHVRLSQSHTPDWASLPEHLLDQVFGNLETVKQCLQFSGVCKCWHSVAKDNQRKLVELSLHNVPMLLVPNKHKKDDNKDEWSVYDVLSDKFLISNLLLPPYDHSFGGSSQGWLLTLDDNLALTLYKPFVGIGNNDVIHLPPISSTPMDKGLLEGIAKYRQYYVMKMSIHTPDPIANPKDFIIAVIFGQYKLAYIRPLKQLTWSQIDIQSPFDDLMYHKNKFYAITLTSQLASFDVDNNVNFFADSSIPDDDYGCYEPVVGRSSCYKRYLVESLGGDLLHVKRYERYTRAFYNCVTVKFKIYKWSSEKWIEIKSIGDSALFLGDNTSVCVLASNFVGCEKDSIYFIDDKDTIDYAHKGQMDLGVYNIQTRVCSRRGFNFDATTIPKTPGRQPIWVLPTLSI
ncbi:F-box protein SKIP23-like [Humulus lupulus]|uniref:F-box protein SKIP23-like n=1 Tax=Humulus lupulus TaxID=3486 RepID=UPI002B4117FD|nr:F-box protein SKIP23-like [Humulus lupulus]